jgi:hypothetical protein
MIARRSLDNRVPDLFPVLRGLIDAGSRRGRRANRFLLLGSASLDLPRQTGESLAGRIRLSPGLEAIGLRELAQLLARQAGGGKP